MPGRSLNRVVQKVPYKTLGTVCLSRDNFCVAKHCEEALRHILGQLTATRRGNDAMLMAAAVRDSVSHRETCQHEGQRGREHVLLLAVVVAVVFVVAVVAAML